MSDDRAQEWNFDGLVGPTHNYAGLSPGNLASGRSAGRRSHPRAAALQGLAKMARLHGLGVPQAVLPPQPRPDTTWLRRLGFAGSDAAILERAAREAPRLLAAAWSASSMWTANAATVIPSADAPDGRVHLVPANLSSEIHRSIEAPFTARVLRQVFPDASHFAHHPPVPLRGDEGAANHMRLCARYGAPGLSVFVFGGGAADADRAPGPERGGASGRTDRVVGPLRHPARQLEDASRAVARLAGLAPGETFFWRQSPGAIDAGVFHNDVIASADRDLLFVHEEAFVAQAEALEALRSGFEARCGRDLQILEVPRAKLSVGRAVASYLFNCQIVEAASGERVWIGPSECREDPDVRGLLETWSGGEGPFDRVEFVELRESMRNGGGPACLRLRVVLSEREAAAVHPGVVFDPALHERLARVIERDYPETLEPAELTDPRLMERVRGAFEAVCEALDLGSLAKQTLDRSEGGCQV